MRKIGYLVIAYVLVFSLLGIAILQSVLLRKQKKLLEQQMLYAIKSSMSEIEWRLKEEEINKIIKELDLLGINFKENTDPAMDLDIADNCEIIIKRRKNGDALMIYDTIFPRKTSYYEWNNEDSVIDRLKIQYYYIYLTNLLFSRPLSQRIDPVKLKKIIDEELHEKNIDVPYEFAIYQNNSLTNIKSKKYKESDNFLHIKYKLFKEFSGKNIINLVIAIKKKDIYKNNLLIFRILSYAFMTIILLSFIFSIYSMMRQRHITELKNDFINNITHEFKTPLATISLIIDSIKSPAVINNPEKVKEYLHKLKMENKRMFHQVEKILHLARMEKGETIWHIETVNVHDVIMQAVEHMKFIFESKKAKVDIDLKARNPMVKGDPVYLFDVFVNLLDNAVKYSKDKKIEIKIQTFNHNNYVAIKISDKGVGMSDETIKYIFEKFYRKPSGAVHTIRGHGIGLTFVKKIISKLKGDIYVESQPGEGTTFTIYLPVARDEDNNQNKQS